MGTLLYFCDLRGPPKPSLRTPWGSMDLWSRRYPEIFRFPRAALNNVDIGLGPPNSLLYQKIDFRQLKVKPVLMTTSQQRPL